jgi:methanogenic corrinoid protein MtbC1
MRSGSVPSLQDLEPHGNLLDELVEVLDPLDKTRFEQKLNGAVAVIPFEEAVQRILLPLQRRVGELWHEGRVNVAVEHYVTKFIQQKLFSVMNQLSLNESGPRVVITCPEGESHEVGAQAVAYIAAMRGCHVYYLGPDLPFADLQGFCERVEPDLVLLSLTEVKAGGTPRLLQDLESLSTRWDVAIGGQGALAIEHLLRDSKVAVLHDFVALHSRLKGVRAKRSLQ